MDAKLHKNDDAGHGAGGVIMEICPTVPPDCKVEVFKSSPSSWFMPHKTYYENGTCTCIFKLQDHEFYPQGSIVSAIGRGINSVLSAIFNVVMSIVSAITNVSRKGIAKKTYQHFPRSLYRSSMWLPTFFAAAAAVHAVHAVQAGALDEGKDGDAADIKEIRSTLITILLRDI